MNVLKLFLCNIFDIDLNQEFIDQFIVDKELDSEKILKHPLLFTNLLYSYVWKYCYGTLPTKKDFVVFVDEHKVNLHAEEPINGKLLEKIVNIFFPLKLGYINNLDTTKLCTHVEELTEKKKNIPFIQEFLIQKWKHRFGNNNIVVGPNIFTTFINMYKEYKSRNVSIIGDNKFVNNLTGSYNETLNFTPYDTEYMTEYEFYQYIMYNDCNMFVRFIDAPAIIIDSKTIDVKFLKDIIGLYEKEFNKTCCIFDISDTKHKLPFDKYYTFATQPELLYILPKMFKTCICISDKKYPTVESLCIKRDHSIHYYLHEMKNEMINETNIKHENNKDIVNTYDRFIVSTINASKEYVQTELNPKQRVYIVPNYYTDLGHNPTNFVHKRIIIAPKTYNEFSTIIDPYCVEKGIQCTIPRNNYDMKADFIIDLYDEIDPLLYNANGVIPLLKQRVACVQQLVNGYYIDNINAALDAINKLYSSPHVVKQFKDNCKIIRIIHNEYFFKLAWKDHIQFVCPHNDYVMRNNILLYYNFITQYFYKNLEKLVSIKMNGESSTHVILIDNRPNPLSIISAYFTMANLKKDNWGFKLFTSNSAVEYYKEYLGKYAEIIPLNELSNDAKFHIDIYNDILKNSQFWEDLHLEKCLIIQDDGIIFREGAENFLEYDYIGAPWVEGPGNEYLKEHVNPNMVGNGGLSIRNVAKMIEITKKYEQEKSILFFKNVNRIPEDVYFCKFLVKEKAHIPTVEIAAKFSSEQIGSLQSLGCHKFWIYHHPNIVEQFFNEILK
jgi:hypothetical protein